MLKELRFENKKRALVGTGRGLEVGGRNGIQRLKSGRDTKVG